MPKPYVLDSENRFLDSGSDFVYSQTMAFQKSIENQFRDMPDDPLDRRYFDQCEKSTSKDTLMELPVC